MSLQMIRSRSSLTLIFDLERKLPVTWKLPIRFWCNFTC